MRTPHRAPFVAIAQAIAVALAITHLWAATGGGIAVAVEAPEHPAPLQRIFAALCGRTFVAPFPDGDLTDTQTFAWMLGGHFVRNRHTVSNAEGKVLYEGETVYTVDARSGDVVWWYWNTTGGYVVGTLTVEGERVVFEGENHAPEGQPVRVRGAWEQISAEGLVSTSYFEEEGGWRERFRMKFVPVEAAEPAHPRKE
jgi:hypothetical protein